MATEKWYSCPACKNRRGIGPTLFEALLGLSNGKITKCSHCGTDLEFYLRFDFGLGVGKTKCRILHSFIPKNECTWPSGKGAEVRFYPFLVVLDSEDSSQRNIWLPYWHTVTSKGKVKKRYGQWAPVMDQDLFESLVDQAKMLGCLDGL